MKARIYFLDHLRTFAIFLVVLIHAGIVYEPILENAWIVSDADPDIIFGGSHERKWRHALARMGIDSGRLQVDPGSC